MTESAILVDGISIFFAMAGSGLPLLFVHGNIGSSLWYSKVMDIPGCRVFALDLPNFGRSGPLPGKVDLDRYADILASFIQAAALDRPILVGHSLGGAVAQSLAARRPELIRGLVLVDSAAPSGLKTPEERHPAIETMRTNPQVLAYALKAVVPALSDDVFFASLVADARKMAENAWIGNAVALSRFDYTGKLSGFGKPVLVIWGRKDSIVTEAMARETVAAFPAARLEIIEAVGHSVMAENPGLFRTIIARFAATFRKQGDSP
jgi:pimeloyl-ACP methyl ester carboxylesterase